MKKKPKLLLDTDSIESSVIKRTVSKQTARLIGVEHRHEDPNVSNDYEEVVLHFQNGGEVSIYVNADGDVIIEGD